MVHGSSGKQVKFWLDSWACDKPLCIKFKVAYKAAANKTAKLAYLIQDGRSKIQLRENPSNSVTTQFSSLIALLGSPPILTDEDDSKFPDET